MDEEARLWVPLAERIDPAARSRLQAHRRAGLEVLEARLPGPFRAMFTTRRGGSSGGCYTSLNLDERSDDDSDLVAHNRTLVKAAISEGLPVAALQADADRVPYRLVSPTQTHGVRVVGAAEYACSGERGRGDGAQGSCDGLTLHPLLDRGLAAVLVFADCVPLVMVGEVDMAVVHGGWRGILGGIVRQAASAMSAPPRLAVIGPSLGPCCFTVGEEVADAFSQRFGADVAVDGRVDLWAAASLALREVGIGPEQIINPRLCTACNRDYFYSYRAEGPVTGRHGCIAWTVPA